MDQDSRDLVFWQGVRQLVDDILPQHQIPKLVASSMWQKSLNSTSNRAFYNSIAPRTYFLLAPNILFLRFLVYVLELPFKWIVLRTWLIPLLGCCKILLGFAVDLLDLAPDLQQFEGLVAIWRQPKSSILLQYLYCLSSIDGNAAIKSTWGDKKEIQTGIKHPLIVCKKIDTNPQQPWTTSQNQLFTFISLSTCRLSRGSVEKFSILTHRWHGLEAWSEYLGSKVQSSKTSMDLSGFSIW